MKKILIILLFVLFSIGCENMNNTPTSKLENYLSKYQKLDGAVIEDLNRVVDKDKNLKEEEKEDYKVLLEKQYQNLSYKIKNENIEDDFATVDVEIEVLDYKTTIDKLNEENNIDFNKKITELKKVNTKKQYEITFYLEKVDGFWKLEEPDKDVYKKIHGLY